MPAVDHRSLFSSSLLLSSVGLSAPGIRRDQVPMAAEQREMIAFERCVTDNFIDLANADADGVLSLSWLCKLLNCFLVCHEEFRALLLDRVGLISSSPLDRLFADFSDRTVKALDVLNATRDGIERLRRCRAFVEIVISALGSSSCHRPGEGQVRRARRALTQLAVMMDDRDAGHSFRNRGNAGSDSSSISSIGSRRLAQFRSPSSGASRSWSAARQLQAIGNNVSAPRDHEVDSTAGLAAPIYAMNAVLSFTLRSLLAAVPCQDRGLQAHFSIPRTLPWAAPVMSLNERILESRKKDRKASTGLLKEIQLIGRSAHHLMEVTESIQFPMSEEKNEELKQAVEELAQVHETMKEGLDTLECQVRGIFLRIARSHTEGLDLLSHTAQ